MIEVQVGEQHVRHIFGCHPVGAQGVEEPASGVSASVPEQLVVDGAHAGVDEDDAIAGSNEEAADVEVENSLLVEGLRLGRPGILDAGPGEDVVRVLLADPVDHREDFDVSKTHFEYLSCTVDPGDAR